MPCLSFAEHHFDDPASSLPCTTSISSSAACSVGKQLMLVPRQAGTPSWHGIVPIATLFAASHLLRWRTQLIFGRRYK
ncbi:hypothetical protein RB213_005995 [Colletotrichum asianum]